MPGQGFSRPEVPVSPVVFFGKPAHAEHPFRRPLDQHFHGSIHEMVGGAVLVFRFERDLVNLGGIFQGGLPVPAELVAHRKEGDVGGVPAPDPVAVAVMKIGLIAQDRGPGQVFQEGHFFRIHRMRTVQHPAFGPVTFPGHPKLLSVGEADFPDGEFVAGEGAGFVARHQGAASQPFDGGQAADDHAPPGHARRADGQGHGQGHRQAFRNGRDGQSHPEEKHLREAVPVSEDAQKSHQERRGQDGQGHHLAEPLHADDEGRFAFAGGHHVGGQAAHLGVPPRGHHDPFRPAAGDDGAGMHHVSAIPQGGGLGAGPGRVLEHGKRFPGQQRFVDFQAVGQEQAKVGGDPVARFDPDDVARNHFFGGDFVNLPVSFDGGADLEKFLQGLGALLRLPFLDSADEGVQPQNAGDKRGVDPVSQGQRNQGGDPQDVNEGTLELPQDNVPDLGRRLAGQGVGTDLLKTLLGLGLGQPAFRGLQTGDQVLPFAGVPLGGGVPVHNEFR